MSEDEVVDLSSDEEGGFGSDTDDSDDYIGKAAASLLLSLGGL